MTPEVHFIRDHLANLPHSFKHICVDDASRHTVENITEAQKIFDFDNVQSISVVGMHYALQRQIQTLKSYFSDNKIYFPLPYVQTVNDHPVSATQWHEQHDTRQLVWGEIMRLHLYEERGFIRLDPDVRKRMLDIFGKIGFTP